jgi:hypothetical protein
VVQPGPGWFASGNRQRLGSYQVGPTDGAIGDNVKSDRLLVVVNDKGPAVVSGLFDRAGEVEQRVLSYRIPLSLHILTLKEYKRLKGLRSPFIAEVEKEGRVLYARDILPP